jgi:tRNA (cmo5U34)-methyltransferase
MADESTVDRRSPEPAPGAKIAPGRALPPDRDRLFAAERAKIDDFDFGENTAVVFDDMLHRSVPYYDEIQRMIATLANDFAVEGRAIYDLGCSTGTTLAAIGRQLGNRQMRFVGIDSSTEMLALAAGKLAALGLTDVDLRNQDLNKDFGIDAASVVLLVLTLQFIRPLHRERVLQTVYNGLDEGGCALLVEKVVGMNSNLNRLFIEHYYDMKRRNGYSELEIAQKREALENVLVPYRLDENEELLRKVGFRSVDVFFKWYNFCGIVAIK